MVLQEDEIELICNDEHVMFNCPGRRIAVHAVENYFGLKKALFDGTFYPTEAGLTYTRFGADVRSLTVTAGVLSCLP